jgi:hypothetical protein
MYTIRRQPVYPDSILNATHIHVCVYIVYTCVYDSINLKVYLSVYPSSMGVFNSQPIRSKFGMELQNGPERDLAGSNLVYVCHGGLTTWDLTITGAWSGDTQNLY